MTGLVFTAIAVSAFGFIAYQLSSFGWFMKASGGHAQADIQTVLDKVSDQKASLVPLDLDELKLLSLQQLNKQVSRGISTDTSGTFTSIYHEPLICYSYKDFLGSDKALLAVATKDDTWLFRMAGGNTEVLLNEHHIGKITPIGALLSSRDGRELARIDIQEGRDRFAVYLRQGIVGYLTNPAVSQDFNTRAVHILSNLDSDEMQLFLSVVLLAMVEASL